MKADKWVASIVTAVLAFAVICYLLQLLGFRMDDHLPYFKNPYNYTYAVALLCGRVVYLYFNKKEKKSGK